MSITNKKIEEARIKAIENYIANCLEKYDKLAKTCLDEALSYFIDNPFECVYEMDVPNCKDVNEFLIALKVYSAKKDYQIWVKPFKRKRKTKIKLYSEWPSFGEYNSSNYYTVKYGNLTYDIKLGDNG